MRFGIKILIAGMIIAAFMVLIRGSDDGYRQYYDRQYAAAVPGLEQKSRNGDSFAAYLLGSIYNSGSGVPVDNFKADQWFMKSARLGDIDGAVRIVLSMLAERDRNGEPNQNSEFCRWYVKILDMAARRGGVTAADALGKNYARGYCVSRSALESRYYFTLARDIDKSFGVRLTDKKPLSLDDQRILETRLAANNSVNTDAQFFEYFFSTFENYK